MAAVLVESMKELTLKEPEAVQEQTSLVQFKVSGLGSFELELDLTTAVRDVKKMATEACNIEPEHMRLIYNDRQLKDADTLELYNTEDSTPIQILFTAGHVAMVGGVGGTGGGPRGGHGAKQQRNPFSTPVRGLPGSKGLRSSRVSGRPGGMALIRKYGIMMKRQEFREKAQEIGFIKYR
ncbi:RPS29 [Symbiodinium sp. CCMP2456]|nr:RPS29 [Symbiodinium sp. CCMP2456]